MTFVPVDRLTVFYEPERTQRRVVGQLVRHRQQVLFEYEASFSRSGLELAPFTLPLRSGVFRAAPEKFDGLFGLFDDSLPDGWGRLLLDRRARQAGIPREALGPLDRLSMVGSRGLGALVYQPDQPPPPPTVTTLEALEAETVRVFDDAEEVDVERLFAIGGSPQGARPKALVSFDRRGALRIGEDGEQWLVKLPARSDDPSAGRLEYAYALMATAAGLEVPATRLLGRSKRFFATRRFDRQGARRVHQLSLAAMIDAPHTAPSVTYEDLLLLTRRLVRTEPAVEELFRRACFNVFAHNRDDHSRNFAFTMSETGAWRVSPAFDLTFSTGPGGEHWMLVAGEGARPGRDHLLALGRKASVRRAEQVIEEVRAAVARFARFADRAGVPKRLRAQVSKRLDEIAGRRSKVRP